MTAMQLYCLLKLDILRTVLGVLSAGAVIWIVIIYGEPTLRELRRSVAHVALAGFLLAMIAAFTPSTKEAAALVVIPKIINAVSANKELMTLPGKIVSLASDWAEELRPEKGKNP